MKKQSEITRRRFLGSISLLAAGSTLISLKGAEDLMPVAAKQPKKLLWNEFTDEEKEMVSRSQRARIALEIDGGSCAEKVLLTTIRSFRKPDKLVSFAASFGGGLKKGDLCGLLTGTFMSIGFASERLIRKEEERPAWVSEKTNEFWAWWEERAPRHCNELRELYASSDKAVHQANFNRMLQRIALKMDEMFVV